MFWSIFPEKILKPFYKWVIDQTTIFEVYYKTPYIFQDSMYLATGIRGFTTSSVDSEIDANLNKCR